MNIDEAIIHCDEVINNCSADGCKLDHKQLKDWLIELKDLKEKINLNNMEQNESNDMFNFNLNSDISEMFNDIMPHKEKNMFYSISNGVCINKDGKYIGFSIFNSDKICPCEILEGLILKNIPVISMPCNIESLNLGDIIITLNGDLGRLFEINKDDKLIIYYNTSGERLEARGVKNELMNQVYFRKILTMGSFEKPGNQNPGMNNMLPLMLMMKDGKQNDNDLKSLMLMQMLSQNNNGNGNGNLMQMIMMSKLFKDI